MDFIEGRKVIETLTVELLRERVNAYEYLPGKLQSIPSRKGVKKAFGRKQILVNGRFIRSNHELKPNDLVQVLEYTDTVKKVYHLDLDVRYEDDHLAVVVKPSGMPTSGNALKTLQNALPGSIKKSTQADALGVPLTVHRLDAKTHGLVVVAKSARARIKLGELFENRAVHKRYVAIVQGKLEGEGTVNERVDSKEAITEFRSKEVFQSIKDRYNTIVEFFPKTGRRHQLRIHMSQIGHPIVGDVKYSKKDDVLRGKGMFLSSDRIEFEHPVTNEIVIVETELPEKFERFKERTIRWYNRVKGQD
tara:strand:- start:163811 stop:164725 length:915 start_codon:yes stop_codon:yes gene_type:complete